MHREVTAGAGQSEGAQGQRPDRAIHTAQYRDAGLPGALKGVLPGLGAHQPSSESRLAVGQASPRHPPPPP